MSLEQVFPNLRAGQYRITSAEAIGYNCLAWAACRDDAWWWPDPYEEYYWPPGTAREETMEAFVAAYGTIGFTVCLEANLEHGFEKLAIFGRGNTPTHAARQLPSGKWTSKLGQDVDIEHDTLTGVAGSQYGDPLIYLKRPSPATANSGQNR